MPIADEDISRLENRLDSLVRTQIEFQKEITAIRGELTRLRSVDAGRRDHRANTSHYDPLARPEGVRRAPETEPTKPATSHPEPAYVPPVQAPLFGYSQSHEHTREPGRFTQAFDDYVESAKGDFEKFVGENLISKIGIVVLVLGVGIGAKYAIDNNLISPLTRIIIGYIFGFGLIGLAIKLKAKYLNFSSVLISGGMAIMYFVTYFAYSAYTLIPQLSAFALMVMFTAFTVAAAFAYNRQVIAHFGLVGAYAVPFLLSSDSGNYLALFTYTGIVNSGILAISLRKNWTPIFYTAFVFTWAIFYGWYASKFDPLQHFYLSITFATIFFTLFFATKAAQKALHTETDKNENLISALLNGLVFYLFCFAISSTVATPERAWIFFSFLAISTAAILVVSFRFYRHWFVYPTFPLVWLTLGAWYADKYTGEEYFVFASVFAAVFFGIFYLTSLFHRLASESFGFVENTTAVLSNAFIFYGFGYSILDSSPILSGYLGLFTAAHSALHLAVAGLIGRWKNDGVDVVQVLTILVLTFATIAVPVQLDGNFVTLMWTVEAALLFWYGRIYGVRIFEYCSYPVMALASISMLADWLVAAGERTSYSSEFNRLPLANGDLVTAMVFGAAFASIWYLNRDETYEPVLDGDFRPVISWTVGFAAAFVLYNALRIEIGISHHVQFVNLLSAGGGDGGRAIGDLRLLNSSWQLIYTIAFVTFLGAANFLKGRSQVLAWIASGLCVVVLFALSTYGMVLFSELRESHMSALGDGIGWLAVTIPYAAYLAAAALLLVLHRIATDNDLTGTVTLDTRIIGLEAIAYGTALVLASCELVNLMAQMHIPDATKLGLSILWGMFALMLVVIGIARNRKHLRISAFVLLGITLAKLFMYDIADLDTIPKTILFVTLGITLLTVSFLYSKYKNLILKPSQSSD
ncbi:MAG: DUF2339 domain-containing protein [bacterium]|nr:DUF2339 domain-containing protein [bacterium]